MRNSNSSHKQKFLNAGSLCRGTRTLFLLMVDLAIVTIMHFVMKLKYLSVSPELIAYAVSNRHWNLTGVLVRTHCQHLYMLH